MLKGRCKYLQPLARFPRAGLFGFMNLRRPHFAILAGIFCSALIFGAGCALLKRPAPAPAKPSLHELFPIASIVDPQQAAKSPQLTRQPLHFEDVSAKAGLNWTYHNGATGRHLFVEASGGGAAWFDYDNDGWLDLFAPQGGPVPSATGAQLKFSTRNALYHNNHDGTFSDVLAGSGLDVPTGYGQGVSAADFDNDGRTDLYITSYGGNHLFRNLGGGKFQDVTQKAGVADTQSVSDVKGELPWPLSSAWGDYDGDGDLDLFVAHYARWSPALDKHCPGDNGQWFYCRPQVYQSTHCRFFRNRGDGTFEDVSQKSKIAHLTGKSMSAAWVDYDADGKLDLFVTNDTSPNWLLHNKGDGTFDERATIAGVALGSDGTAMSGMGVGIGDYDNDLREDIFVVNYASEPKSIFRNLGNGAFQNNAYASNVASTNLQLIGFGLEACDYDLDGHKDLIIGNGHVLDRTDEQSNGSTYAQSQQLLHNQGDGTFADDWHSLGDLIKPQVTRGIAVADYDNDGDLDVVMVAHNTPLKLFRNDGGNANHWISFAVRDAHHRSVVGAKVTIESGGTRQTQAVRGGSSFCSTSDPRINFGLGKNNDISALSVRWPDGKTEKFGALKVNAFYQLLPGQKPKPLKP